MKVGVLLAPPPADLGQWLADAAAFDVAGADALWIDVTGDPELDPLAVTAALAVLTYRSLLVTTLPAVPDDRMLATVGRLSRGRLALCGDRSRLTGTSGVELFRPLDGADLGAAGPVPPLDGRDLAHQARAAAVPVSPLDGGDLAHQSGAADLPGAGDGFVRETGGEPERWVRTAWSGGRAAWRAAVAEAAERGAAGMLVAAVPPLLDILRNPGDPGDRRDLQIAQG